VNAKLAWMLLFVPAVALAKEQAPATKAAPAAPAAATPAVDPLAWRATQPAPGAESNWVPPVPKSFQLSNGIPVILVENQSLPVLSCEVLMAVGREANPEGKAGLGSLTADLLTEGTTTRTGEQIAIDAAMLGADLDATQSTESARVVLDALSGDALAPSLDLLADVVLHPKFNGKDVKRARNEALSTIQGAKDDPQDHARRLFAREVFGADHPYGHLPIGDEDTVSGLTKKDVKSFYSKWWHAGNASIIVSGATTQAEIQPMLEARFGKWAKGSATRLTVAGPKVPTKTQIVFAEQPGAVQSVIVAGTPGVARASADYMQAMIAGTAIAGMFSAPLNLNLREAHGWSYGIYGSFSESRDWGVFRVAGSVQADKTAPAVGEVLGELNKTTLAPPSAQLLTLAKDSVRKSLAGNFETNRATVASFEAVPAFGLPLDLWATYPGQVDATTAEQVYAMNKTYFAPARQLIVVVGPRTVTVDDGKGGKVTVDVVSELKALGYDFTEV
jgi:zinc protease